MPHDSEQRLNFEKGLNGEDSSYCSVSAGCNENRLCLRKQEMKSVELAEDEQA